MIKAINAKKIIDFKLYYNNIICPENIKPHLTQLAEKHTNYQASTIKQKNIDVISNIVYKMINKSCLNVYSDYKENEKREININNSNIVIIFNINNIERLLIDAAWVCVLIDLSNFTHDLNCINKYASNRFYIIVDPYYIIFSKIWILFPTMSLFKISLTNFALYSPDLYKYLNRISIHLNYLYSKIDLYINDDSISKKMKLKKILEDKDIQNILKIYSSTKVY